MKIATIVTVVALATGSAAFAADYGNHSDRDTSRHAAVVQHDDHGATHEGFIERTKRALHRMGQKLRSATHRHSQTAAGNSNDTRSMGAAGDHDNGRQDRLNQAYNDWQHKHDRRDNNR